MTLTEALKPYLWLAAIGFIVGFMTYIAAGKPTNDYAFATRASPAVIAPSETSFPASAAWNIPKAI